MNKSVLLLILVLTIFSMHAQCTFVDSLSKDPCGDHLFSDMVIPLGYPFQSYTTITDDGYILRIFRIQAKNTKITTGKPVVFLQHGLLDSADDWVVNDEDKSLAFVLANSGYDVWLGNSRGNKYSRANKNIPPSHRSFWDYSFQEMGEYDVKANIGFVINFTNQPSLIYIGHSQGTSQMFAALGDPKTTDFVNQRVKLFVALGPVVYLPSASSKLVKILAENTPFIEACKVFGVDEFLPGACSKTSAQSEFEHYLCVMDATLCDFFISIVADYNPKYDNEKRFPVFVQHSPSGSSLRSLLHYRQLFELNKHDPKFRKFDFGKKENEKRYGQSTPPYYDLSLVKIPVRALTGLQDELADPIDCAFLDATMQKLGKDYKTWTFDNCGHLTFMWAKDPSLIFGRIMSEIAMFA